MRSLVLVGVISIAFTACLSGSTVDGQLGGPVGSAVARITSVPPMVGCVSITAAGSSRTVVDNFSVTPGQPATLTLGNLPVGNVAFSAAAYAQGCNAIGGAQPSWASTSPFFAPVAAGQITSLTLTLEPTGGATIGINFDGDGGTGDGGFGDGGFGDGGFGDGGINFDGGPSDLSPGGGVDGGADLARPADLSQPPVDLAQHPG